jgi:predicted nucleic acid-binding protein
VAGVIVLDASVVIAYLDAHDAHHRRAVTLLEHAADDELAMSALTLAEVLVAPARAGRLDDVHASVAELGIIEQPLPHGSAVRLAARRARTGLRMPDCCVLLAAEEASAALATFDDRLAREAAAAGIEVLRS